MENFDYRSILVDSGSIVHCSTIFSRGGVGRTSFENFQGLGSHFSQGRTGAERGGAVSWLFMLFKLLYTA